MAERKLEEEIAERRSCNQEDLAAEMAGILPMDSGSVERDNAIFTLDAFVEIFEGWTADLNKREGVPFNRNLR